MRLSRSGRKSRRVFCSVIGGTIGPVVLVAHAPRWNQSKGAGHDRSRSSDRFAGRRPRSAAGASARRRGGHHRSGSDRCSTASSGRRSRCSPRRRARHSLHLARSLRITRTVRDGHSACTDSAAPRCSQVRAAPPRGARDRATPRRLCRYLSADLGRSGGECRPRRAGATQSDARRCSAAYTAACVRRSIPSFARSALT